MYAFLRNRDLFGHPVQLNFNRSGPEHNTVVGGVVSLVVKAMMLTYVLLLSRRMVQYEDDDTKSVSSVLEFDYEEGLKISNMSRTMFYKVKTEGNTNQDFKYDDEFKKHLMVVFKFLNTNTDGEKIVTYGEFHECTDEDFSSDPFKLELW